MNQLAQLFGYPLFKNRDDAVAHLLNLLEQGHFNVSLAEFPPNTIGNSKTEWCVHTHHNLNLNTTMEHYLRSLASGSKSNEVL